MEFKVRYARMDDFEGIVNLLSQLSPPKPGENLESERGREILKNILNDPDYCLCVAESEGNLLGTATLLIQQNLSHGGRPYAHIENVITDIKHRKKGVGLEMIKFLIEKAKEKGCYKVILNCETKNIAFYEKCGFCITGEVEMRINL
ncbi:MAG TPA: GNAT family N-acetyltransferase [bacterium]|nr:GNAT family N-acetyltransferase [bacterium]HPP29764.1 GNAT family N-acetyltransferase [bacterium]